MQKWGKRYPDAGYGGMFYRWLREKSPEPYGSFGNGSAMRVSELLQATKVSSMEDIQELFRETSAQFMENGLQSELDDELGYGRYDQSEKSTDNSRNGYSSKTLKTSFGDAEIAELADDDVEDVVGGVYHYQHYDSGRPLGQQGRTSIREEGCAHDFTDMDCLLQDACDYVAVKYYGCSSGYYREECKNGQEPVKV